MCNRYILFTTDVRCTFANLKNKIPDKSLLGLYSPGSTYAKRSLITSIRDNFVIKRSSGVTKRLSNSPLSPRQITCKIFSYPNNVIV